MIQRSELARSSLSVAPTVDIPFSTVSISSGYAGHFKLVDVTDIFKGWLANPGSNHALFPFENLLMGGKYVQSI
jgi:hypothetical protein